MDANELESCKPAITYEDMKITHIDGAALTPEQLQMPAYPCGLVAKTLFNGS